MVNVLLQSQKTASPSIDFILDVNNSNEAKKDRLEMEGCRIVDITYYEEQMAGMMNNHGSPTECNFSHMRLINEKRNGVGFIRTFKCAMCNIEQQLFSHRYMKSTKESKGMNPNMAAVIATILAGVGQIVLDRILSSLSIPVMSCATYAKYRSIVVENLYKVAVEDMKRAAEKAANVARQKGDVAPDGVPLVPVICDGAWCRRTYGKAYNSLGGCGVIIAADTGEVLFIAVKNKFCVICAKADNKNKEPKKHKCFKNWPADKSSASMESAAIVEGFLRSEELYGIRYHKIIADGDSSVYRSVLEANPYENLVVEKIECKNHLLRNFCSNIQTECLSSSSGNRDICAMKKYVSSKLPQLRRGVLKAIEHRSKEGMSHESAALLAKDIINAPSHVFGEHLRCKEINYFCDGNPKNDEQNKVPELKSCGLYSKVMERCNILANNVRSLLHNKTTNAVESFNAIIASKISGKRVNYTARDSYQGRICAAVSQHADGEAFRKVHKKLVLSSPAFHSKILEQRLQRRRVCQRGRIKKRLFHSKTEQHDYGVDIRNPDMSENDFNLAKERCLTELKERNSKIAEIEFDTKQQRDSAKWHQLRSTLVTASNVGKICRMREQTSTASLVSDIMRYKDFDNNALKWGRDHEDIAKKQVEKSQGMYIKECGLFIHPQHFFIGASPDGLVNDDSVVEVKCPYAAKDMTIKQAVELGAIKFLDTNLKLRRANPYFYQIQCQLEVTDRQFCIFVVWTTVDVLITNIKREKKFWQEEMYPKIEKFFYNCLLFEIVDSRKRRNLEVRNLNLQGEVVRKKQKVPKITDKKSKKLRDKVFEKKTQQKKKQKVLKCKGGRKKKMDPVAATPNDCNLSR